MIQYGQYNVPEFNEMVNFGVGQPSTELLPLDIIKAGLEYTMNISNPSLLQYGDIPGYLEFRKSLATFLKEEYDKDVDFNELFTTNGVTQALSMICSLYTKAGDVILVEEPTYFLAINIFKDFNLNIKSIPMSDEGVDLSKLEQELIKYKDNERVFFYTIPTFHNPMGVTTSHTHRLLLSALADKYSNLNVIADEVYQLLYFDENKKPPSPLRYYHDNFISLGSFSKILAPSLRLGWIQASNKFLKILHNSGQLDSSGGLNPFISSIVHGIINKGLLKDNILETRKILNERCTILYDEISRNTNELIQVNKPYGGYFLWLKLNKNIDSNELILKSDKYKVKFHPGNKFSSNQMLKNCLRISFSFYPKEGISVGADRLKNMIADHSTKNTTNNINVAILGYSGKLGSMIVKLLEKNGFNFNGKIDRNYIIPDNTDVILDVSSAEGTSNLITKLKGCRIPIIIGTTGDLPYKELKLYSRFAPVAVISNFSEGIPVILEWSKIANSMLDNNWEVSINEIHHIDKIDKPSGTAKTINNIFNNKAEISSKREGDIYGEHTVLLESDLEYIEVVHRAKTRSIFADGAIKYLKWITKMKPGYYTKYIEPEIEESLDTKINFMKYNGCGNDFIMIDVEKNKLPNNLPNFIKKICKRGSNIGADGVILINIDYNEYDAKWIYYNSDGSMAKMCGNGLRCTANYVYDNTNKNYTLKLITGDGLISIAAKNKNGQIYASIPMPKLNTIDDNIRGLIENILDKDLFISKNKEIDNIFRIDVTVPHVVILIKSIDALNNINVNNLGKIINDLFDDIDVNINFVGISDDKFCIRTYERGVFSETLACGTGCCAFAFIINNFMKIDDISIHVKSGDIVKIFFKNDSIFLEGNSKKVYKGLIDLDENNE